MGMNVGDQLIERLREWGVRRIFGYPGDGINGILGAMQRAGNDPEFIQSRHEEMSAFMACGHAKFTGEVGVCLATSGPGAIHLLNGLYDARLDHQPVVAIVGQTNTTAIGGSYQQEVDLLTLFKDVAGAYCHMITAPEQLPNAVDRAVRIAATQRTVTCLIFPADVQEEPTAERPPHAFKMVPGSLGYAQPRIIPPDDELHRAAAVLNEGTRVAVLVGQGARRAAAEVVEVADLLGAGVAKALLGKDVLPDDLPFVTGSIGLLGTKPSYELMADCDTLLMIGSSLPYSQFLPEWGQARGIDIDIDPSMIGIRYPMEVNLVGDSQETLRALIPLLERKTDRAWRKGIEEGITSWWRLVEERAMEDADPINPQRLFHELSPRLPEGCIVTSDSGSAANWYARNLRFRAGMRGSLSGTLATMGPAVPYAFAAKMAHPDRTVIALTGDGAMQMNGMNELLTIAKYWTRWETPHLVVAVLHNNDLNQVTWEQRAMEGNPEFTETQDIPDIDYAAFARMVGLDGIRVERPDDVGPAWERALAAERPVVIDALVDPDVPPIPPHVDFEQAKAMMSAVMKGDPHVGGIVKQSLKQGLKGLLPGRG
jgi:pyruvate dehydrogenase (quinone)